MKTIFDFVPASREARKTLSRDEMANISNKAEEHLSALCSGITIIGSLLNTLSNNSNDDLSKEEISHIGEFLSEAGQMIQNFQFISSDYNYSIGEKDEQLKSLPALKGVKNA